MAVATRQVTVRRSVAGPNERTSGLDTFLKVLAYLVLTLVAVLMFVPFLFSLATSFKTQAEAARVNWGNMLWVANPITDWYRQVLDLGIERWFFNSVFVAVVWVVARCLFDSLAGYAFARMSFPGRGAVFLLVVSTLMIPGIVTLIPRYALLQEMGLYNSFGALTVPFLSSAFGIFLMKQFFESLPRELEEAARVDGASRFRMFWQIALPNAGPALTSLAIFTFQGSWNNFLEPVAFISNPDWYTLPVGLAMLRTEQQSNFPLLMAVAVISTIPIAIFYLIFQRWFVEGQSRAGIKG
ncbi:MAG: carbohydrate ABC transporter permease [Chloroflexota bacterium]|nr:carbohydrate ABC transporter permease [Chloroflexota bacterium]